MKKSVHDAKYRKLLDYLKAARLGRQLTVRELGSLIDETHQIVSKIETGTRKLSVLEFVQYCEALGLDPKETIEILR